MTSFVKSSDDVIPWYGSLQGTYSTKKTQRSVKEDVAEGVCCIASLSFIIFARKYSFAEGVCCIVGRNFVVFMFHSSS